jgi:hypothetical protein
VQRSGRILNGCNFVSKERRHLKSNELSSVVTEIFLRFMWPPHALKKLYHWFYA